MRRFITLLWFLWLLWLSVFYNAAFADYIVTGNISADHCAGFLKHTCSKEIVAAFKKEGQFYKMPGRFATVSSYGNNHCTIQVRSQVSSQITNRITGQTTGKGSVKLWTPKDALVSFKEFPDFYKKNQSGQFVKISPSYLAFRCTKTLD